MSPLIAVSISFDVPLIVRVSDARATPLPVPLSAATARVVDMEAVPAAVNLP